MANTKATKEPGIQFIEGIKRHCINSLFDQILY
jgi:hypothetical protein